MCDMYGIEVCGSISHIPYISHMGHADGSFSALSSSCFVLPMRLVLN